MTRGAERQRRIARAKRIYQTEPSGSGTGRPGDHCPRLAAHRRRAAEAAMNTGLGPGADRSRAPVRIPMRRVPCRGLGVSDGPDAGSPLRRHDEH
jgi:hypothetical protein